MKILLLEDEKQIAENIKEYLKLKMWWKVDIAWTIKEAEEKIEDNYYDILLFDVMLPDGESYELANEIKKTYDDLPIIFLTAKWELEDKLLGFDSGGDDYITKPFELDELIARIQTIAKRFGIWTLNIKWVDLDLENRKVSKDWEEIKLNKTEFSILEYLVSNRWKIVERTDLIDYVWGEELFDEKVDRKLDVYIANIRKKLGKDFIETIKWVGYKV
jgi:DNA-binding response OmpR family regulator